MSPRDVLRGSSRPDALPPATPLAVLPGDTVGVVLLSAGGPAAAADVEPFLYNRLMDPAEQTTWLPSRLRSVASRVRARREARRLSQAYELVGGAGSLSRHTAEQAAALQCALQRRFGARTGATFRTYTALRHWHPTSAETAEAMALDGVTQVVLLPLHPHFSSVATGAAFAGWERLAVRGDRPDWPTARVGEYAAHPKYVQALAERVDEGLQRFPREIRRRVQVVFSAQGRLHDAADRAHDPYCCLVHATVQAVADTRADHDPDRRLHVAFGQPLVRGRALGPEVRDTIRRIAEEGEDAVLVVPVSFVSDCLETAYELDVLVREQAAEAGIAHFEVTRGLNGHPLFVDALADCVASRLEPLLAGNGTAATPPQTLDPSRRSIRCAECTYLCEPCAWPTETPAPAYREAA